MLIVHHLASSQSERIVWLCEELGIAHEFRRYDREPNGAAPPDYKALSPFETAPVITDGDLTLGESGAIVEYLCRSHGGEWLMPGRDHRAYADYLFWFHFANGSYLPTIMLDSFARRTQSAVGSGRLERAVVLIEKRLGDAPYFAGEDFTAADVMMCLTRYAPSGEAGRLPHIAAYLDRVRARPACKRAMEKVALDSPF